MEQYNSIDSGLGAIELEQANPNEGGLAAEVVIINGSAIDLHFVPPSPPVSRSLNPGPDSTASPIHRFRAHQFVLLVLYPMFVLVTFMGGIWELEVYWGAFLVLVLLPEIERGSEVLTDALRLVAPSGHPNHRAQPQMHVC